MMTTTTMTTEEETPHDVGTIIDADVDIVEQKLKRATERRELLQLKVKDRQSELESLIATSPSRPREKISELDEKIAALERERTMTSIALQEERKILWEMKRVEKLKQQVVAFEAHDKRIKDQKALISDLRESLMCARDEVDNLYAELSVTKTASRVGCTKEQVVGTKVACPPDQIGQIIGKKGANVRQLMERASVTVDVRKDGDVRIMGSLNAVDMATNDLSKVLSSTEGTLEVPQALVTYLTAKDITALDELRKRHPDVNIFVQRKTTKIPVKGTLSDIENVKKDLLGLDIATHEFDLPSKQAGHVVGKQGGTIESIQARYQVAVNLERREEMSRVTVVGPTTNNEEAILEIQRLAAEVQETTHTTPIDPNAKAALFLNGGAGIQDIRKKVNEKLGGGSMSMNVKGNEFVLTGSAMHLSQAIEIVEREIKNVESTIVTIDTDPAVVPVIIGKGGSTIKELREGKTVNIETDRTGKVTICGLDKEQVADVEQAVRDIISLYQVTRINIDASLYKSQANDLLRARVKTIGALCALSFDDDRCDIVLRGEGEKVDKAEAKAREFLETNYKEDVNVTADDMRSLLLGGKTCKMEELAAEYDVKLHSHQDRGVVEAKGKRDNVQQAVSGLHRFLFGGDGYAVAKIALCDETLGMVIGKGGKNKADLQKKFENVSFAVNSKEYAITLRGPEKEVEDCKVEVFRGLATTKVTRTVKITQDMHDILSNTNATKDISKDIPVYISLSNDAITVRGFDADVKDAIALLNNAIHGRYESRLVLPLPQFIKVRDICSRNSVHLERVMKASGASAAVDSSDESIVLRGKREEVKSAKAELVKFLDFLLQSTFYRLAIPGPLIPVIADAPTLSEASAISGASVVLDRDINCLFIFSTDASNVVEASAILTSRLNKARRNCFELQLGPAEDHIVSAIIGKRGSQINSLRKSTNCQVEVDSDNHKIRVAADDPETLAAGREALETIINKARSECSVVKIPEKDLPGFIGRGGAGISEFAKTHGVEVQVLKNYPGSVRLTGEDANVAAAMSALQEWEKKREDSRKQAGAFDSMKVEKSQIRVLLANKGALIHSLQDEFNCRIDIDKEKGTVSIRSGKAEKRKAAVAKIKVMLAEEQSSGSVPAVTTSATPSEEKPGDNHRKKGGKKEEATTAKENKAAEVKDSSAKTHQSLEGSDFPVLENLEPSRTKDTNVLLAGSATWVSIAASQSDSKDDETEEDQYLDMVAEGADLVVQNNSVTV